MIRYNHLLMSNNSKFERETEIIRNVNINLKLLIVLNL